MADTRSKQKKGVEQRVEEELGPLVIEDSTPMGMDSFARYMLESNKASEQARKREEEEREVDAEKRRKEREVDAEKRREEREARVKEIRRKLDLIDAEERQEERDRIRRKEAEEAERIRWEEEEERLRKIAEKEWEDEREMRRKEDEEWRNKRRSEDERIMAQFREEQMKLIAKVLTAEARKRSDGKRVDTAETVEEEEKDKAAVVAQEMPRVSKPVSTATPAGSEAVGADKGVMAADRPVKTPESVPPVFEDFEFETDEEEEEEENSFAAEEKDDDLDLLAEVEEEMVELVAEEKEEEHSLAEGKEELVEEKSVCLKPEGREETDLVVPPGKSGNSSSVDLEEENHLLVLPVKHRKEKMAHDKKDVGRTVAEGDFILRKFGQDFARRSSVLSPWTINVALSVVERTEEELQVFRDVMVSLGYFCIFTIPSEEDVFVLLLYFDVSGPGMEHLNADALSRQAWKSTEGDPWRPDAILQREEKEQEEADKLRAATNSQLVGGDVGTSPTGEKKQKEPRKDWDDIR